MFWVGLLVFLFATFGIEDASGTSCDDFTNATACIEHTMLSMHTCVYCVTEKACHAADSPYDTCKKECCASKAFTSTCSFDSLHDIDVDTCSFSVKVDTQAWSNPGASSHLLMSNVAEQGSCRCDVERARIYL